MVLGAVGKSYYLFGDIDRVLPEYIVWPGMLAMNVLVLIGIIWLWKKKPLGYVLGVLLALFYIITMLLNVIDALRGIHADLVYFLYGPLVLIVISLALIIMLFIDYDNMDEGISSEGEEKSNNA